MQIPRVFRDTLELDILDVGGLALLDNAHAAAAAFINHRHPWDGRGEEPVARQCLYCVMLWGHLTLAQG